MKGQQNNTWGRYGDAARGHDGASAAICRVVVPATLIALSALATRFWWRVWLIGPSGVERPSWMVRAVSSVFSHPFLCWTPARLPNSSSDHLCL